MPQKYVYYVVVYRHIGHAFHRVADAAVPEGTHVHQTVSIGRLLDAIPSDICHGSIEKGRVEIAMGNCMYVILAMSQDGVVRGLVTCEFPKNKAAAQTYATAYLDVICSNGVNGAEVIAYAVNAITAFHQVENIRLTALPHVVFYYEKLGFVMGRGCNRPRPRHASAPEYTAERDTLLRNFKLGYGPLMSFNGVTSNPMSSDLSHYRRVAMQLAILQPDVYDENGKCKAYAERALTLSPSPRSLEAETVFAKECFTNGTKMTLCGTERLPLVKQLVQRHLTVPEPPIYADAKKAATRSPYPSPRSSRSSSRRSSTNGTGRQ